MNAVLQDFSVTIGQRRRTCVLDPTLALSSHGLFVVERLGEVLELWVVRELWRILDNTHFYLRQPDILKPSAYPSAPDPNRAKRSQEIFRALRDWEKIRFETDPNKLKLYWIGDGPCESLLPEELAASTVWRYEALSSSLDNRLAAENTILSAAFRDVAALAVTLPAAIILTHLPESGGTAPALCNTLESWGISCRTPAHDDALVRLERDYLRQLLVLAGLAGTCWAGFSPVVLHLYAPAAISLPATAPYDSLDYADGEPVSLEERLEDSDPWLEAQGFWYPLLEGENG